MAQPKLPVQALVHAFHCRDANCVEQFGNALNPLPCGEAKAVVRRMKAHVESCFVRRHAAFIHQQSQQQGQADVSACKVCRLWDALHRTTSKEQVQELVDAAWHGRAADVTRLLAEATTFPITHFVNTPAPTEDDGRVTALAAASSRGHAEVVTLLLAADADVDLAGANWGVTPLWFACRNGHTDVVTLLLAADADVNRAMHTPPPIQTGPPPMGVACKEGHLDIVQLLSSYGASRTLPHAAPFDTAEHVATHSGQHEIAAWLVRSRDWSRLHHLEVLTPDRALELLRAGAHLHAAAAPGGETPLDRAKELCSTGAAAAGSAAHVVLEWGAPWSRQTHKFYPPEVRARVVEVLLRPCALFSRKDPRMHEGYGATAMVDAFEASLVKYVVASAEWR